MRRGLAVCFAVFGPAFASATAPPVASFTNSPQYATLQISPGGTYLALARQSGEYHEVVVIHRKDMKPASQANFGRNLGVESFVWANDSRLLVTLRHRFEGKAVAGPTGSIYGFDANGGREALLFCGLCGSEDGYAAARVIDPLSDDSHTVLIQTASYASSGAFNKVYAMDTRNGRIRHRVASPIRYGTFITDADRHVAVASGEDFAGDSQVYYRNRRTHEWTLKFASKFAQGSVRPVARASRAGSYYVLDDRDASTDGVFVWTPETDDYRLLFRHPEADVELAGLDRRGEAWAFRYVDHFAQYWYPQPDHPLARLHRWLLAQFPGHRVGITSHTDDFKFAVARVSGSRSPAVFFVVDVIGQELLQKLESRPDLSPNHLAEMIPIEVTARDGLKVRGYLTVPGDVQAKRLPMVVLVHDGPDFEYFDDDFDYEAQLFASRGYAVLQVNFRGSPGRGREFRSAGYREWGRKMQDDLTDAVRWAIEDGVADPERICIHGVGYGGYAALTGAYRDPDLFRCAIGVAGFYDLPLMYQRGFMQTSEFGRNYLELTLGTDEDELRRRSPVYNAEKIRAPVLLLHGRVDERAPFEHASRMRNALARAGNAPELVAEWGDWGGFYGEVNRREAFERMLAFVGKHIGGGLPMAESESEPAIDQIPVVKEKSVTNAELLAAAKAAGYQIVNEDGTPVFCKTEIVLGSRLIKRTRCLTEAEMEQERQAAERALSDISRASSGRSRR